MEFYGIDFIGVLMGIGYGSLDITSRNGVLNA